MFTLLGLWQQTRTKYISLPQAGYTHRDAACELKHGVSNYSSVAQSYRLANLLTDPLSCILCVPSLQTNSSMIIITPLLFQQKLEHIPALGSETGDFRCAWRSLRTSATNIEQHRVLSKQCLNTVFVHNLKISFLKSKQSICCSRTVEKKTLRLSFSLRQQGQTS